MPMQSQTASILQQRRAGVLLHPTSLPGPFEHGDLGKEAYRFVDFLIASGITVWQVLPLGPTHADGSPYQCLSAHAGNPLLISLDWLAEKNWLDPALLNSALPNSDLRQQCLEMAKERFFQSANKAWLRQFEEFKSKHREWLTDYALFIALKQFYGGQGWSEWPETVRLHDAEAIAAAAQTHAQHIAQIEFEQFIFFTQWHLLRTYANTKGVLIFGDIPIYVAYDSADVWAEKENFLMNHQGTCTLVAGVPPDVFSEEGQRWGNPLYDWAYMQSQQFSWWKKRLKTQLECFDVLRIDHFLGLESCWQIPAEDETAKNGAWTQVPGRELLTSLTEYFGSLPLVAEDLGLITAEVETLRKDFELPGMKILQFAFDGDIKNPYLPENHETNSVVYTGTHDNDTTLGWHRSLDDHGKWTLHEYLSQHHEPSTDMPWALNRMAMASICQWAILPMQDVLSLDSSHRMNTPGTVQNNWQWRFKWEQLWPNLEEDLMALVQKHQRLCD